MPTGSDKGAKECAIWLAHLQMVRQSWEHKGWEHNGDGKHKRDIQTFETFEWEKKKKK
jgi:hypothetical protein